MRARARASSSTAAQRPSEATQAAECWGSSGRGSPAQHSRALRNLNAEVAHTNAEVRQTLSVVEQAGVRRVVGDQRRQVRGQDGRSEDQGVKRLETALCVVAAEVAAGDARLCSELGIDEVSCCRIDWLLLAADVPVAWLTAAA